MVKKIKEVKEVKEVKKVKKVKVAKKEPKKKYFVRDTNDRFFNREEHGFDLILVAGIEKEIDKKIADAIKKDFSYLEIEIR